MVLTADDITPAHLDSVMPILQRIQDDLAALEDRGICFERKFPPRDYVSFSATRGSIPKPVGPDLADIDLDGLLRKPLSDQEIEVIQSHMSINQPFHRYSAEQRQESERISRAWKRGDEQSRAKNLTMRIMIRHTIKKRWTCLGVWDPKTGVPDGVFWGPRSWPWWDSALEYKENPEGCAIRLYLQRKRSREDNLALQALGDHGLANVQSDDGGSPIASRPWFVWEMDVAEEQAKLLRNPKMSFDEAYELARASVTTKWQDLWKESWSDKISRDGSGVWTHYPGWKWRHESPSPEPPDPNDMEFTPSEVDALEAISHPTPPPQPWSPYFGFQAGYDPDSALPASAQSALKPWTTGDDDHEGETPRNKTEPISGASASQASVAKVFAPRPEPSVLPSPAKRRRFGKVRGDHDEDYLKQPRPMARGEIRSSIIRETRGGQKISRTPTASSKFSTPPSRRCSARVAERQQRLEGRMSPKLQTKTE